jgi:hypothetical protein
MKPTRKQQYSLHYFSLHEAVSWFNYKSTSCTFAYNMVEIKVMNNLNYNFLVH